MCHILIIFYFCKSVCNWRLKIENCLSVWAKQKSLKSVRICGQLCTSHWRLPSPPHRGRWRGAWTSGLPPSLSHFLLQSYIGLCATWLQTYNRGWKEIRIIRIMSLCFDGFHRRTRGRQTAMPVPTLISIGSAIATTCLRNWIRDLTKGGWANVDFSINIPLQYANIFHFLFGIPLYLHYLCTRRMSNVA